jgi:lipoprotein-anchoring transpeptidase ErfK/SrfK
MRDGRGGALHMSWLATALVGALAVVTPLAATIAGESVAHASPIAPGAVIRPAQVAANDRTKDAPERRPPSQVADPAPGAQAAAVAAEGRLAPERGPRAHLLVEVASGGLVARARPSMSAPVVGTVAASSKYYHVPTVAWVERTRHGWGSVELPYVFPRTDGWVRLAGLDRERTWITVRVDLSEHRVRLQRRDHTLATFPAAIGTSSSPTPPGEYFVTDRVPFSPGSALGSFAFGISGIQPRLPAGWTGGNQLAIHGTNEPWSIGTNASAGCVRVSEVALGRLKRLLELGTPVLIHA